MPQVFHVICCYDCQTFQVQQVKKSPKWVCKMCGAKQSLKKVYGCGSGVDCRKLVQSLNLQKMNAQVPCDTYSIAEIPQEENKFTLKGEETEPIQMASCESTSSKWKQFLEEENDTTELDVGRNEEELMFTTDRDVMLREARELRKLRRQEWKAGKRKRNSESKPYIINDTAKRQPVTENYSRNITSSKKEQNSFGNAHEELGNCSMSKQDLSADLSQISVDRQQMMDRNLKRFQDQRPNQNHMLQNINSKKHDTDIKSSNNVLKSNSSSSKWSQFLEVDQDDTTDDEDDSGDHLEKLNQSNVNTNVESEGLKSDSRNKDSILDKGKENNQFNLNIDIDEVFEDW